MGTQDKNNSLELHDEEETETEQEPEPEPEPEKEPLLNLHDQEVDLEIAKPCKDLEGYYTCRKTKAYANDFCVEIMKTRVIGPKAVLKDHHCMGCCKPLNWTTKNIVKKNREEPTFAWCSDIVPPNICVQCNANQKTSGINAIHALCGVCWVNLSWTDGEYYELSDPRIQIEAPTEQPNNRSHSSFTA